MVWWLVSIIGDLVFFGEGWEWGIFLFLNYFFGEEGRRIVFGWGVMVGSLVFGYLVKVLLFFGDFGVE